MKPVTKMVNRSKAQAQSPATSSVPRLSEKLSSSSSKESIIFNPQDLQYTPTKKARSLSAGSFEPPKSDKSSFLRDNRSSQHSQKSWELQDRLQSLPSSKCSCKALLMAAKQQIKDLVSERLILVAGKKRAEDARDTF